MRAAPPIERTLRRRSAKRTTPNEMQVLRDQMGNACIRGVENERVAQRFCLFSHVLTSIVRAIDTIANRGFGPRSHTWFW